MSKLNTSPNSLDSLAKFIKYGIYLVALVPLVIFSDFISPFHFGKVIVFRSIVELMLPLYIILVFRDRRYLPKLNSILVSFLAFTSLFAVSASLSINPYLSFWGSLERMGGWFSFVHYFIYYVILISIFKNKEDWLTLLKITIFVGILSAFYGFGQKTDFKFFIGSGGRARIFGTLGNAALFAGYELLILFLALTFIFSSWLGQKQKKYYWFSAVIAAVAIIMTVVRGSILALGFGFLLFSFLYTLFLKSNKAKKVFWAFIILAVIFIAFSFAFKKSQLVGNSDFLGRITDISFKSFTVQTRFWAWQAGITGWKETSKIILLGWGPENFNIPFSKHFNPRFYKGIGSETLFDRAHNMFIEVLVTMGLFAFLLYVAIFVFAYKKLWKFIARSDANNKMVGIGLITLLTVYIIHNLFFFDTSANFIVFFTVLGFIDFFSRGLMVQQAPQRVELTKFSFAHKLSMLILLLGVSVFIYKINILPAKANYGITRGIIASWAKDFEGAVRQFQKALSYDVPGKYDYRHRFAQFVLEQVSSGEVTSRKKEVIEYTIREVKKNAEESRQDYLPYLYISRLYIILGKDDPKSSYNDIALENSRKALEIAPRFVRTFYEVAQAYLNKQDFKEAIKYFSQAAELNPDVGLSHWYLAISYLQAGDYNKGLGALEMAEKKGYAFSENDILRLIPLYLKVEDYRNVAKLYERLIQSHPENPQYFASLAVAYAQLGQIDKAIKTARHAAALDKSFESDARIFIESLGRKY